MSSLIAQYKQPAGLLVPLLDSGAFQSWETGCLLQSIGGTIFNRAYTVLEAPRHLKPRCVLHQPFHGAGAQSLVEPGWSLPHALRLQTTARPNPKSCLYWELNFTLFGHHQHLAFVLELPILPLEEAMKWGWNFSPPIPVWSYYMEPETFCLDHTHDVRGTSQLGGVSEQLIVALFLNHLLCSVDRALLPWEGSFFFFFNIPLSLSIILHHESLTPSSITALTFRNYGLPSIWLTTNSCLTLIFCGLSLSHPAPATSAYMTCPSLWSKEPPGLPEGHQGAWTHKANTTEWHNVTCHSR